MNQRVVNSSLAQWLGNGLFQLAYVTNNLTQAQQYFKEKWGIEKFLEMRDTHFDGPLYEGKPTDVAAHYAFGSFGNLLLELIEPITPEPLYRAALTDDALTVRFHHYGVLVPDLQLAEQVLTDQGYTFTFQAKHGDDVRLTYVDATAEIGHYLELVQAGEQGRAFFDQLRSGHF